MNIFALELARIPNVSLKTMLRLAKTLLKTLPPASNDVIENARKELQAQIELVHASLLARMGASPEFAALEVRFDFAVDALWMLLRRRLEDALIWTHDGFDLLSPERAAAIDLDVARDQAVHAQALMTRVFGATAMVELLKQPYVEQVESTAALLRLLQHDGLQDEVAEIVGKPLLVALEVCQAQYEDMVDSRLGRQRGTDTSLAQLRQELRWALTAYVTAVLSLARPKPADINIAVLAYLQPIVNLRESLARTGSEAAAVEELDELEPLDELTPAEQPSQDPAAAE